MSVVGGAVAFLMPLVGADDPSQQERLRPGQGAASGPLHFTLRRFSCTTVRELAGVPRRPKELRRDVRGYGFQGQICIARLRVRNESTSTLTPAAYSKVYVQDEEYEYDFFYGEEPYLFPKQSGYVYIFHDVRRGVEPTELTIRFRDSKRIVWRLT